MKLGRDAQLTRQRGPAIENGAEARQKGVALQERRRGRPRQAGKQLRGQRRLALRRLALP